MTTEFLLGFICGMMLMGIIGFIIFLNEILKEKSK